MSLSNDVPTFYPASWNTLCIYANCRAKSVSRFGTAGGPTLHSLQYPCQLSWYSYCRGSNYRANSARSLVGYRGVLGGWLVISIGEPKRVRMFPQLIQTISL